MSATKTDVSAWLRLETPKHLDLLTKLRETLTAALTLRQEPDADGELRAIPPDLNDNGSPNRDWCRGFTEYRRGYETLLQEERERAKLLVMAQSKGQTPLTDEEYEQELRQLGVEALSQVDDAVITAELERRGMTVQQALDVGEAQTER